jgi:hypothetical protein
LADRQAARQRETLRVRVAVHEAIRERFRAMGVGPEVAVSMRSGDEAATELAAIPDTPDLKAADEAIVRPECSDGTDRAHQVREKIARMAEEYRDGEHQLDLANASPAELLAFCVAVEMERGDDMSGSADRDQRLRQRMLLTGTNLTVCPTRA